MAVKKTSVARSFSGSLERLRSALNWVIVRIPFDVAATWGAGGRLKVKGEINGFPFRTSLFPGRDGSHFVLVNKRMQKGAQAQLGSTVDVRLERDTDERVIEIPIEFKHALSEERALLHWFSKLSYSTRKWITQWVTDAKSSEARRRRSQQAAEQLLSTMEAEQELPPMIRAAFARHPQAHAGWRQMSPGRRRGWLLAIFHCRTPESRARRLGQAMEEAATLAEKKSNRGTEARHKQDRV
jgi:uncharacterized protein YdeI (YjbR/CyaY-like superfamily)